MTGKRSFSYGVFDDEVANMEDGCASGAADAVAFTRLPDFSSLTSKFAVAGVNVIGDAPHDSYHDGPVWVEVYCDLVGNDYPNGGRCKTSLYGGTRAPKVSV